jgi:hypothetical protein
MDALRHDRSVSRADPKVKRRLGLLDQLEAVMGMRLDDTAWRDSDITPLQAGGALKRFMRGEAARLEAEERMRYRAAELDRIAAEAAKHARELREAIAEPPTMRPAS